MPLEVCVQNFGMAREEKQFAEIIHKADSQVKGTTVLFPEYGAFTVEGSRIAFEKLSRLASSKGVTIITSLNLSSRDLPYANPEINYNTLFVFSRNGCVYSPQAKITPQSFEMNHLDENSPKMNVMPYNHLNRVTLKQNDREYQAFFIICSDLYVLQLFSPDQLRGEALFCPANFGNGAEGAAEAVIDYFVKSGLFNQGFFSNTYQKVKKGLTPYAIGVEKVYGRGKENIPAEEKIVKEILSECCAIYPDEGYLNFGDMLSLTQNGTFTVPRSRSIGKGLKVELGVYEKVIEL